MMQIEITTKKTKILQVRHIEGVLKQNQHFVQSQQDTVLSTLFEKLAVGYNTLGMKYLKLGKTDLSLKFFQVGRKLVNINGSNLVIFSAICSGVRFAYKNM